MSMSTNQKWGFFLLITILLGIISVFAVYSYRGSEQQSADNVVDNNSSSSGNQNKDTPSKTEKTDTPSNSQDPETRSENQNTETSPDSQNTDTTTPDIDATKKYSACLKVDEPSQELRPNYLTVTLKVKNNCDTNLDVVAFSLIGKDSAGNNVEEKINYIYSFSSGDKSFVEADFNREKNIDNFTWEITKITDK